MIEAGPDGLAGTPRMNGLTAARGQITPAGRVVARPVRRRASVFADHVRHAGILKGRDGGAVTVVSGHIPNRVEAVRVDRALHAAQRGRARRVEPMREVDELAQQRAHPGHDRRGAEERFVAHAPDDDRRVVAMDPDHLGKLLFRAGLERRLVFRSGRIAAPVPVALRLTAVRAPEAVLGPEQNPQPVARLGETRRVRVVRTANEVEAGLLDERDVAREIRVRRRVSPARPVLMHVGAAQIHVLAVQEEALVGRPPNRPDPEDRDVAVRHARAVENRGLERVEERMIRMPQSGRADDRTGHVDCRRGSGSERL